MSQAVAKKVEEAQVLVRELIELQTLSRKLDVTRGRILWELKANNLYKKTFGEGVDTWEEFLRSPEIALTTSEANRMMQMYEYFVIKYELSEDDLGQVPVKTLHYLLPRLKSGEVREEDLPELVEAGKSLTFHQFRETLYDIQNVNEDSRTYTYMVMRKCNETKNLSVVQEISSKDILSVWPQLDVEAKRIHTQSDNPDGELR